MLPTLLEIGPFTLSSLWVFVTIGFIVGTLLFLKKAKYVRSDLTFILDHSFSLLLGTVFISRLTFFLTTWGYFGPVTWENALRQVFFFWQPGYTFWGAVIGFVIVFLLHCTRKNQNALEWLDIALIPIFIGMMVGNIGQFLDGQGYGKDTDLPWGVTFESTTVKYTVPIHPTQLYSIILIAFIILTRKKVMQKWPFLKEKHNWTLMAITFYSFSRFWLEFLRGDDTYQIGFLRMGHIISAIVFVPMAILMYKRFKKFSK